MPRLWGVGGGVAAVKRQGDGSALHYNGFCLQSDRSAADAGAPATAI